MKKKLINYWKENILGEQVREIDKEKTLISLLLWTLFIIIVSIIVVSGNNNNNNVNNEITYNFLPLDEIVSNYNDYKYRVDLSNNGNIVIFNGGVSFGINMGELTYNDEVINYQIESNTISDAKTGNLLNYNYLYYFFNIENIYNVISNYDVSKEEIDDDKKIYVYNCVYNGEDITFKIITGVDNIKEINYTYDSIDYKYIIE